MRGGVAHGWRDLEQVRVDWAVDLSPAERLAAVFDMWDQQASLKDPNHEVASRLQRSVGGVRPRRS